MKHVIVVGIIYLVPDPNPMRGAQGGRASQSHGTNVMKKLKMLLILSGCSRQWVKETTQRVPKQGQAVGPRAASPRQGWCINSQSQAGTVHETTPHVSKGSWSCPGQQAKQGVRDSWIGMP